MNRILLLLILVSSALAAGIATDYNTTWQEGGGKESYSADVYPADVDGDSTDEIVVVGYADDGGGSYLAFLRVFNSTDNAFVSECNISWQEPYDPANPSGHETYIESHGLHVADVDGDSTLEIVAAGYTDSTGLGMGDWQAFLRIFNVTDGELVSEYNATWDEWTGRSTAAMHVSVGNLDADGGQEIMVVGSRENATFAASGFLRVFNVTDGGLVSEYNTTWEYLDAEETYSEGGYFGDVDGDATNEVVTVGFSSDGDYYYAYLNILSVSGGALVVENSTYWKVFEEGDTQASAAFIGSIDGDAEAEIVVTGFANDGSDNNAMLYAFNVTDGNLLLEYNTTWLESAVSTDLEAVFVSDCDSDATNEVSVVGTYWSPADAFIRVFNITNHEFSSEYSMGWQEGSSWDTIANSLFVDEFLVVGAAYDGEGIGYSFLKALSVDVTAPSVTPVSPADNAVDWDGSVDFSFTVTDTHAVTSCVLFLNDTYNGSITNPPDGVTQTFSRSLYDGMWYWLVQCTDVAANSANSTQRALNVTVVGTPSQDQDADGLTTSQEEVYGTNPLNNDSDGDGFLDGDEVGAGSNPLDANSVPDTVYSSIQVAPAWDALALAVFLVLALAFSVLALR
ncbi:MAG: hypothetical protein JW834_02600 [Candidatus Diapherotrites archaeon]|nr:hypothetical protein [Candidatus Diapherotrites archaeon]